MCLVGCRGSLLTWVVHVAVAVAVSVAGHVDVGRADMHNHMGVDSRVDMDIPSYLLVVLCLLLFVDTVRLLMLVESVLVVLVAVVVVRVLVVVVVAVVVVVVLLLRWHGSILWPAVDVTC